MRPVAARRFIPVPYDALNCCRNEKEYAAVVVLYREAHTRAWQPWVVNVREVARWGGLAVGSAHALLGRLDDAALIGRRKDGRITWLTVECPTSNGEQSLNDGVNKPDQVAPKESAIPEQSGEQSLNNSRARKVETETRQTEIKGATPPAGAVSLVAAKQKDQVARSAAYQAVWAHYRTFHPPTDLEPGEQRLKLLKWAVDRRVTANRKSSNERARQDPLGAAVKQVQLVIDFFHLSPDKSWYQGDNDDGKPILRLRVVLKKQSFAESLESARVWHEAGRPLNPKRHLLAFRKDAERAWSFVSSWVSGGLSPPEPLHADAAKAAGYRAGIRACGGWSSLRTATERDQARIEKQFTEAYAEACGGNKSAKSAKESGWMG